MSVAMHGLSGRLMGVEKASNELSWREKAKFSRTTKKKKKKKGGSTDGPIYIYIYLPDEAPSLVSL